MAENRKEINDRNREWGEKAEAIAADYLLSDGYTIRERRWRIGKTIEIDLIAEKDGWMIFIEVKARKGDRQEAVEAVDKRKRIKMVRGADIYLKAERFDYAYRFDIIAITGDEENYQLEHFPDAFLPPLNGRY